MHNPAPVLENDTRKLLWDFDIHTDHLISVRRLTSIQDRVKALIWCLEDYIHNCGGRLITITRNNKDITIINRTEITGKPKWKEKQLYGHFKRQTNEISHKKTWIWIRKENLKRETESLLIAAQNNTIRTNCIKARIDKTLQNCKCRLCDERDEMINKWMQ